MAEIEFTQDQHGTKIQALKARNTIYEWAVFSYMNLNLNGLITGNNLKGCY